ncbi:MAG: hypothetical protein R3321_05640 [Nitrososphaeraceae archaeon]|nr:hypothetical protein [Nitrososphaeraceae archaeon]
MDIIKNNIGFKKITFLVIIGSLFFINSSFLAKSYSIPSMIEYKMNNNQNQYSLITIGMNSNLISDVLPATIQMIYNSQTYEGKPIFSIYRGDSSFSAFQKPQFNISNINTKIINVENGSEVEFKIIDYPQVLKPSYLGITAYNEAGEVTQIIESEEFYQTNSSGTNKVKVDMEEGVYTLIATATWDGETEDVEGFQLNAFKINLINNGK